MTNNFKGILLLLLTACEASVTGQVDQAPSSPVTQAPAPPTAPTTPTNEAPKVAAPIAAPTVVVPPKAPCADYAILGKWTDAHFNNDSARPFTTGLPNTLTITDDCKVVSDYCGSNWTIDSGINADRNEWHNGIRLTVDVRDGFLVNACPTNGPMSCTITLSHVSGKDAISFFCGVGFVSSFFLKQ